MTDKLSGIKAGDRVRVMFEGDVCQAEGQWIDITVDEGDSVSCTFSTLDLQSPHFHIERIEKSLGVGDRVKDIAYGFGEGEILAVDGRMAFVRWDMEKYESASIYLSNLERLS